MPARSGSGEGCLRDGRQPTSCCALTWWMGRGSFWGLFMRALMDGVSALMTPLPPKGPPPNASTCGQYTLLEGHKHSVSSLQLAQPKTGLGPIHSAVLVPPSHSRSEFGHWNPDPSVPRRAPPHSHHPFLLRDSLGSPHWMVRTLHKVLHMPVR